MDGSLDRVWSGGDWNGSTYTSLHRGSDSVTVVGAHSISCLRSVRKKPSPRLLPQAGYLREHRLCKYVSFAAVRLDSGSRVENVFRKK